MGEHTYNTSTGVIYNNSALISFAKFSVLCALILTIVTILLLCYFDQDRYVDVVSLSV